MSDSEPLDSKNRLAWELLLVVTVSLLLFGGVVAYNTYHHPRGNMVGASENNLRMVATAASQYMLEHHVEMASYTDLVGTATDKYIRSISPVVGERYDNLVIYQTTTQISTRFPDGTVVDYNL